MLVPEYDIIDGLELRCSTCNKIHKNWFTFDLGPQTEPRYFKARSDRFYKNDKQLISVGQITAFAKPTCICGKISTRILIANITIKDGVLSEEHSTTRMVDANPDANLGINGKTLRSMVTVLGKDRIRDLFKPSERKVNTRY